MKYEQDPTAGNKMFMQCGGSVWVLKVIFIYSSVTPRGRGAGCGTVWRWSGLTPAGRQVSLRFPPARGASDGQAFLSPPIPRTA